ncbi:MAG: phytoene desaturase family protein, partial [Candidatus Helarchaeales archaeon]
NGKKVLVLERNARIGGRCSSYQKKGFTIDYGTHVFVRCEFGPIGQVLSELNQLDKVSFFHLTRIPFYLMAPDRIAGPFGIDIKARKSSIPVPTDVDLKSLMGKEVSPKEFDDVLAKMANVLNGVTYENSHEADEMTFREWCRAKNLQFGLGVRLIMDLLFCAGLCIWPEEGSAGEFLRCLLDTLASNARSMFAKNVRALALGYPRGSCQVIPDAIGKGIQDLGGVIKTTQKVARILVSEGDNKIKGIEMENGKIHEAPLVISNIGPKETIDIVGKEFFPSSYVDRVMNLKPAISPYSIKIALDKEVTQEPFIFNFSSRFDEDYLKWKNGEFTEVPLTLFIPAVSVMSPELVPKGKQLLIVGYAIPDKMNYSINKITEQFLSYLEYFYPHYRSHVEFYDVFGPDDLKNLWHSEHDHGIIRVGQYPDQVGEKALSSQTPIDGLYVVGTGIGKNVWGIGTDNAVQSGLKCAELILNKKQS